MSLGPGALGCFSLSRAQKYKSVGELWSLIWLLEDSRVPRETEHSHEGLLRENSFWSRVSGLVQPSHPSGLGQLPGQGTATGRELSHTADGTDAVFTLGPRGLTQASWASCYYTQVPHTVEVSHSKAGYKKGDYISLSLEKKNSV